MDKLKLPEVLERLEKQGLSITKRTFQLYQSLGLLPKPEKQVGKRGRGLYGFYNYKVVSGCLKLIYDLKKQGNTLFQISKAMDQLVLRKYRAVLKKWGFSDFSLSEMDGYIPKEVEEGENHILSLLKEAWTEVLEKDGKPVDEEVIELYAKWDTPECQYEKKILEDLHWFYAHEMIEGHALRHISDFGEYRKYGLWTALVEVTKEYNTSKNKAVEKALLKLIKKLRMELIKLNLLLSKVNARVADLIVEERYRGSTKEQWERNARRWEKTLRKHRG